MVVVIDLTNGLVVGIEHLHNPEDEDIAYMIVLHLTVFKIMFFKRKNAA